MKPHVISHMMESVDGRIDCAMTEQIEPSNVYYDALDQLACPTTLEGRVTMQIHFAEPYPFRVKEATPIGKTAFHKASEEPGYAVALDTKGRLCWPGHMHDGKPLLVVTSEDCPREYHDTLIRQCISWIAVGKGRIDLKEMLEILNREFNVDRMAVVGGGHINGSFLAEGLLDEISVMIGPGIDGRKGMASVFDGIDDPDRPATLLKLNSLERMGDTVWLRYTLKSE